MGPLADHIYHDQVTCCHTVGTKPVSLWHVMQRGLQALDMVPIILTVVLSIT